jgi:hypothetical protein
LERTEHLAEALIGLTESDARTRAESAGVAVRIARRDGQRFPLRLNFDPRRVNLAIEGETVTGVTVACLATSELPTLRRPARHLSAELSPAGWLCGVSRAAAPERALCVGVQTARARP